MISGIGVISTVVVTLIVFGTSFENLPEGSIVTVYQGVLSAIIKLYQTGYGWFDDL